MVEKMNNDVLPCPFCGSTNIFKGKVTSIYVDRRYFSDGEMFTQHPCGKTTTQSECLECGATGPQAILDSGEVDYGDIKAIAAWNRRPERL